MVGDGYKAQCLLLAVMCFGVGEGAISLNWHFSMF